MRRVLVPTGCLLAVLWASGAARSLADVYDPQSAAVSGVASPDGATPSPALEGLEALAPPLAGTNVNVVQDGSQQNETTVAVNPTAPTNLVGGANDYRNGPTNCGAYRSVDNGETWTGGTLPLVAGFTDAGDPGVAFDANGHAYFLCMNFNRDGAGNGIQLTQYVQKSSDGGGTWGPPVIAAGQFQANRDDKGHIAVDAVSSTAHRGNVYVSFTRLNTGEIRFNRSTDGAVTFEGCAPGPCTDIVVNDANPGVVQGSNIAVGADGAVYVAWADNNGGATSRIMIDKSTDGGVNFGALGGADQVVRTFTAIGNPDLAKSVRPLGRVNSFPVIATHPTNASIVYAVWAEDPAGADDSDIMFSRSTDGGNTWDPPVRVNDDVNPIGEFFSQFFPWMAVDPTDGSINIVWYDDRDDPNRTDGTRLVNLYFASSTDEGLTFGINKRVSTQSSDTQTGFTPAFFGDYNGIAAFNGVAFPLWADSRDGDQDIMTTQIGGADLRITKSASPDQAAAGELLTYEITVTNDGPAVALNVQVVDTLPAGVTHIANTGNCSGAPLTCSLGDIAPGDSVTFTIQVRVDSNAGPGPLTNTATVDSDQDDPTPGNNTASVSTIVVERADLKLTKQCKPDAGPAPAGGTATCTIFVDNLGPSDARNVVVTDTHLSNGSFTITSATFTPPAASACAIAGGVVTCNLGTEPAGGRTTITVVITSDDGVDVNDTATVTSTTPDPNTANNQATGAVSFQGSAELGVTKSDSPDPVTAGTNLTYTIGVTNGGPSTASNVVLTDVLPAQVSVVSATATQGSCSGTTVPGDPLQPLTCNLGSLADGASATVTVVVTVKANTPNGTILINNAAVHSAVSDPNNGNNNVTSSTTVQTRADLAITKTSDQPIYKPSSLITYTITVRNNGPSDALAAVVTDNLPSTPQAHYLSDTGGCTKSGLTLTCQLGYMAVGEVKSFNINMIVRGSRGLVTNTASVASTGVTPTVDPVLGNNTAVLTVTVGR